MKIEPTQTFLRTRFDYQPDGTLTYRHSVPAKKKGTVAGTLTTFGYLVVGIAYDIFFIHRLVWIWHHGPVTPGYKVDHIDQDKLHNRIENLRLVTGFQNAQNQRRSPRSKHSVVGIRFRSYWEAVIGFNGKSYHLGRFKTETEAILARKAAEVRFGFHPNHGKVREPAEHPRAL